MGTDVIVITNRNESPNAAGEIKQVVARPSQAPAPMQTKPSIVSDHSDGTPEQGQLHFVGREAGPWAVMPMQRGPKAAHKPCTGSTEYCFFLFFGHLLS